MIPALPPDVAVRTSQFRVVGGREARGEAKRGEELFIKSSEIPKLSGFHTLHSVIDDFFFFYSKGGNTRAKQKTYFFLFYEALISVSEMCESVPSTEESLPCGEIIFIEKIFNQVNSGF